MKILAIETSCDDTGVAILETSDKKQATKFKVLSNIVSSQQIHKNYGGVFPMMAKREHQKNLVPVLEQALKQAKLLKVQNSKKILNSKLQILNSILEKEQELLPKLIEFLQKYKRPNVDLIAVTNGPGLEPCLWVGVNFAKALSYFWDIPVIPVNHIEAHILVNFLPEINSNPKSKILNPKHVFPAISLVVSGGHTQLILVEGIGKYKIIGETRDDAAGECFDKCAKLLGLGYPGGPIISKISSGIKESSIKLPRPMVNSKDYDFSFSGLKTAVLYKLRDEKTNPSTGSGRNFVSEMCFEIQQAIIDVLIKKTIDAARNYKAKTIILGGGVSANEELRKQFSNKIQETRNKIKLLVPPAKLSTDNGLMIAVTGYFHQKEKTKNWRKIKAIANLRVN